GPGRLALPVLRRVFRWWLSPDLVIGLFPPWYAAPQPDWPPQLRLAGFGRFDGARGGLPDDVRMFCLQEPPPIVFTLSTGMRHAADFFRTAVAACDVLGARGLLLTKYPDIIPARVPPGGASLRFRAVPLPAPAQWGGRPPRWGRDDGRGPGGRVPAARPA